MNEPKDTDFFPETHARDAHPVAPETYRSFQETEEDLFREEQIKEIEAEIDKKFGAAAAGAEELGELPYDEEADRKRWDELEKDFDRVFDEAKKQ